MTNLNDAVNCCIQIVILLLFPIGCDQRTEKEYIACFRMSFDDFMRYFEKMEICNLGPDVMDEVRFIAVIY